MTATRFVHPVLIAVLASGSLWYASNSLARSDLIGVSASIEATHLELRVQLPAICLRLRATLSGLLDASAQFLTCDGCESRVRVRHWT